VPAADTVGGLGRAAEVDRQIRTADGTDLGVGTFEAVVAAGMVERAVRGPEGPQDVEVLVGAGVPLVLVEVVAVLALVGVAAPEMT
jgi:hypothetical protein